ncbi:putative outer membrane efflux protein [Megalodesulfovibrio gigas DSM 1382 = ATCC 19364]|uniref:Putative outer membrane efflux protein n=2 Tax=Megalodesulfovibrio gigas TaxID=879 RepID=T2G677_MEGG1|nr:putative outer membrane efflux protein [Megalodesulfovibrio gigas DSM 1382 = ATCC 19364]
MCPDKAARRSSEAVRQAFASLPHYSAATRDVFHRPSSNTTVMLLDRHPAPGEWTGPLTMGAAIRIGLARNAALQEFLMERGVPRERLRAQSIPPGQGEALEAFSETPFGYAQLAPGWPRALAEDYVRSMLGEISAGAATQPAARDARLELSAVAAALDVILDVREHWYAMVAASQAHVATMDELLAAEAAWQMAQALPAARPTSPAGQQRLDTLARFEIAQRQSAATEAALHEARRRMQQCMSLEGDDAGWHVPPLLPGRPVQEAVVDEAMLTDAEQRSVKVSLDLALVRHEVLRIKYDTHAAAAMGLPENSTESGTVRVWLPHGDAQSSWANWAFPAPFFAPSFTTRTPAQAAQEREWRRYQAMASVVRTATRAAGQELLAARQTLERLEQQRAARKAPQLAVGRLESMRGGVSLLESEHEALARRRALIAAQLDYWLARTRLEHLLAGRMAVPQSPLAFRQVSIMQPPAE